MPIACGLVVIHQEISENRQSDMSFFVIRSRLELLGYHTRKKQYYGHHIDDFKRYWCKVLRE